MKGTVVFDFDGVVHSYKSGWLGENIIPDPPVNGIKEVIEDIRKAGYEVVIVSTRCANYRGQVAILEWLKKYDIAVDDVKKEKPPAKISCSSWFSSGCKNGMVLRFGLIHGR